MLKPRNSRFDFVNPDIKDNKIYHGAMPRIGNYLNNHKENARLYKFIADAPTTTMQRINGLITGNIPAFIDAGENFAATEIHEDNLLSQLNTQNRSTILLGDDTWIKLLPNTFTRTFEMDSFDVKDLDTVDSTIKPKLFEELKTNNFTLLISHFLGVDHCGHRYGPNHPEMRRKLNEMDQIVAEVVESLDDKTVLFVFGDHGMTEGGDHGGDANLEVEAALFVYSKKPLPRSSSDTYSTVSQIDLLPTISLLLDSPIPFSNLGAIIEDLFEQTKVGIAREMNVMQVIRYVSTYKIENPTVQRSIKHAIQNYESQLETDSSTIDKEIIHELRRLIIGTINNFDMSLIYIGLASFTEALLSVCVLLSGYKTSLLVFIIFRTGVLFLQYAIYLGGMAREDNSILTYMAIYLSIAYSAVVVLDRLIYSRWTKDLFELAPTLLPVLLCVGLFSNSFIIYGAITSRFLLTSIMVIEGIRLLQKKWQVDQD
ncbi:hypothetical protein M3Y97_00397000 [Aphelenchoides bicaudatus]|nr:hypothetical protein M3Y97_00397000 [Aphelenchoides bicaudatus]